MRKITIQNLVKEIEKSISLGGITTYYIVDIPVCEYEGKRRKERVILDVQDENKYDTIFEELNKSLQDSEKQAFWYCNEGVYSGEMIIDSTVIVAFNYCSLEGQVWLYKQYKNQQ